MEEKNNIAKILKDKPEGTKLWTDMFGSVTLYVVTDTCDAFQVKHHNKEPWFDKDGKLYKEGVLCIYPSKSMRSWHKFAWKKGDVLVSNDGKREVLFKTWVNDSYTKFVGLHCLINNDNEEVEYDNGTTVFNTNDFKGIEAEDVARTYINAIEERLGGKLNRETLEVEKAQPEFKDGDIITFKDRIIIIYNTSIEKSPIRTEIYYHACLKGGELTVNEYLMSCGFGEGWYSSTEEEKHQLFDALAKEGKQWDSEKKMIVGLKPKVKFKHFDKVLCRNSKDDTWEADFFARLTRKEIDYTQSGKYLCVGDLWMYCIPYNEETKHLLGTTDEWKGGEG